MGPQQTMMLDSTSRMDIVEANLGPLINFKILDFSGTFDFKDVNPPEASYLEQCGAMIFVLDVQVIYYIKNEKKKLRNNQTKEIHH